jgi:hypothetical protein
MFSSEGQYLKSISFDTVNSPTFCNPTEFALSQNETEFYLWGGSLGIKPHERNDYFALYKIDSDGEISERYFNVKHSLMGSANRFRYFEDICNIEPVFGNDTIYSIELDQVRTRYFIDFRNRAFRDRIPENLVSLSDFKERIDKTHSTHIMNFIETRDWCYFSFYFNKLVYNAYYSKKTDKTYVSNVYSGLFHRISPGQIDANNGSELVTVVNADYLVREIARLISNRSELSNDEEKLILKLLDVKETDNPVLLVCELRNDK